MPLDLKPPRRSSFHSHRSPRRRKTPLMLILLAGVASICLLVNRPSVHDTEAHTSLALQLDAAVPAAGQPQAAPEPKRKILQGTIQPGDTITSLFKDYFTEQDILYLSRQSRKIFPLSDLCAGQPYRLCLTDGAFERFEYDIDRNDQLIILREEDEFEVSRIPIDYTIETEMVRGTIETSLFEAVMAAGENAELAVRLADVFAYDIDFIRDLRVGDTFQAVLEKRFREGQPAGYGRVLAAEFVNQGREYQAFLFKDGKQRAAYYNAKGESLRTMFLRAPLSFTRISSGFSLKRFHPITKTWRSHPAIDYAAAPGTPIHSVGDGTVIRKGYTRGNGNYIKIRHANGYETMYLHMSRFARGMANGRRVAQGQVIGYVGSTGLATGPHLCFRMSRHGSPVNPYSVRTAAASPVSKERMTEFRTAIAPMIALLESGEIQQARADIPEVGNNEIR